MNALIEQFSFIPTSAAGISPTAPAYITGAVKRPFGDFAGDVCNVKSFGAIGDNTHDDTDAVQTCINTALGGGINYNLNRPVFFPAGQYRITRPLYILDAQGAHIFGAGMNSATVNRDGTNGSAAFHGYIVNNADPNLAAVLTITSVESGTLYRGSLISGAGVWPLSPLANFITGTGGVGSTCYVLPQATSTVGSSGSPVAMTANNFSAFYANGLSFSLIEELSISCLPGAVAFDYDWARTTTSIVSSQKCVFKHVGFGSYGGPGAYGCRVGASSAMTDTSTWISCVFGTLDVGLAICNANSICHNIYGGEFQNVRIGIWVLGGAGSINAVSGVSFVSAAYAGDPTQCDIQLDGGGGSTCAISGCSSESHNQVFAGSGSMQVTITGCEARSDTGTFYRGGYGGAAGGGVDIAGCNIRGGRIESGSPVTITNCKFYRVDALDGWYGGSDGTLTVRSSQFGGQISKFIFNRTITKTGIIRTRELEVSSLSDQEFLYESQGPSAPVNVSSASPAVFDFAGWPHWFMPGQALVFTGSPIPTGMTASKIYYVVDIGATVSISASAAVVTTSIAHGLLVGDKVLFTGGTPPTGINRNQSYYVVTVPLSTTFTFSPGTGGPPVTTIDTGSSVRILNSKKFNVAATSGGTAINTTSTGTSVLLYLPRKFAVGDQILKNNVAAAGSPGWVCTTAGYSLAEVSGSNLAVFGNMGVLT